MRKLRKISVLVLGAAMVGGLAGAFAGKKIQTVKAEDSWTLQVAYVDVLKNYIEGAKLGDDSYTDTSGRFKAGVRYGNLYEGKLEKFSNCAGFKSSGNPQFYYDGTSAATCTGSWMNNWQCNPKDSNDCILFFEAVSPISLSVPETDLGGTVQHAQSYFIKRNGDNNFYCVNYKIPSYKVLVQEKIVLNEGDTFYWCVSAGSDNSVINSKLPKFDLSNDVSISSMSVDFKSFKNQYAKIASAHPGAKILSSNALYVIGIKYGTAWNNALNEFENISSDGIFSRSGSESSGTRISAAGTLYTNNNIGIALTIKPYIDLVYSSDYLAFGGAPQSCNIAYAITDVNGYYYTLKNVQLTKDSSTSATNYASVSGIEPLVLKAGETLTWEFRLTWKDGWDHNIQTPLPCFHLSVASEESYEGLANRFVFMYMKFGTVGSDVSGEGKCVSEGWYTTAKAEYEKLANGTKTEFAKNAAAVARLKAWAAANGEEFNPTDGSFVSQARFVLRDSEPRNNSSVLIISIVSVLSISILGFLLILKKRKLTK